MQENAWGTEMGVHVEMSHFPNAKARMAEGFVHAALQGGASLTTGLVVAACMAAEGMQKEFADRDWYLPVVDKDFADRAQKAGERTQ